MVASSEKREMRSHFCIDASSSSPRSSLCSLSVLLPAARSNHDDNVELLGADVQAPPGERDRWTRQERGRKKSERHREPIGLPTPRSFAHPRKKNTTTENSSSSSTSPTTSPAPRSSAAPAEAAAAQQRLGRREAARDGPRRGVPARVGRRRDEDRRRRQLVRARGSGRGAQPDAALLRRRLDQCTRFRKGKREREKREERERRGTNFSFLRPNSFSSFSKTPPPTKTLFSQTSRPSRLSTSSAGTQSVPSPSPRRPRDDPGGGPRRPVPRGRVRSRGALRPHLRSDRALLPGAGPSGPCAGLGFTSSARSPLALSWLRAHLRRGACPSGSGSGSPWGEGRLCGGASPAPSAAASATASALLLPPPTEEERRRERRGAPGRRPPSPSTPRRSSASAWRRPRGPCPREPTRAARTSVSFEGKTIFLS